MSARPTRQFLVSLLLAACAAWPAAAAKSTPAQPGLAPGSLDTSYGEADPRRFGMRSRSLSWANDDTTAPLANADGTFLVATNVTGLAMRGVAIARFLADGRPDGSFGTAGHGEIHPTMLAGYRIAKQPDGRIVVLGETATSGFAFARFNANGTVDATFGSGGIATMTAARPMAALEMAVLADGRIVVGGLAEVPGAPGQPVTAAYAPVVARFNADGTPDNTFGDLTPNLFQRTGFTVIPLGNREVYRGIAILPYFGSYLFAMSTYDYVNFLPGGYDFDFRILSVTTSGAIDPGWGVDGQARIPLTNPALPLPNGEAHDTYGAPLYGGGLVLQPDFKVAFVANIGTYHVARNQIYQRVIAARFGGDGALDPSFGGTGWPGVAGIAGSDPADSQWRATLGAWIDGASGRLVAAGGTRTSTSGFQTINPFLVDFGTNGSPGVFASGSPALLAGDEVNGVARAADGKFVFAGKSRLAGPDVLAARYTPALSPATLTADAAFGIDGAVRHFFPRGAEANLGVASLADGTYLYAGSMRNAANALAPVVTREPVNGTALATTITAWPGGDAAWASAAAGANTFVTAGFGTSNGGRVALVGRWLANGTFDPAFNGGAPATAGFTAGTTTQAASVAVQPDGKIVVAGRARPAAQFECYVERFNADGTVDSAFAAASGRIVSFDAAVDDLCSGVAIQADGRIVLGGFVNGGKVAVARLNANGTPDTSFGTNGRTLVVPAGTAAITGNVAIMPDGGIAIPVTTNAAGVVKMNVIRFTSTGQPDAAFGTGGLAQVATSANALAFSLARDDFGRILVGGSAIVGTRVPAAVARLLANGAMDPSFGTGGVTAFGSGYASGQVNAIAVQPSGRILAAGAMDSRHFVARLVTRGVTAITVDAATGTLPAGTTVAIRASVQGTGHTGSVALRIGGTPIAGCGFVPVISGIATCTFTAPVTPGTIAIDAQFSGDALYEPATSAAVNYTVASPVAVSVLKGGAGSGTVTSSPAGIDCGATCLASYGQGTTVTLTAAPTAGSQFSGWSGLCAGTGPCVLTLGTLGSRQVTATFAAANAGSSADLSIAQSASTSPAFTGKDVIFTVTASNAGPVAATNVVVTSSVPAGASFIWASPGCTQAAGTVTCPVGSLASGASAQRRIVLRPTQAGSITHSVGVSANEPDANAANNANGATIPVSASPAGTAVQRYRLFSPVTLEHLYTTDLNEYDTLGSFVGTWVQEGTIGKVYNNPGAYNGVAATPYYRLYNGSNAQHHWTTDPNEYYTLILFPQYAAEGVDGYIFPTQPPGTIPLYRLLYPFSVPVAGLHHWTIDVAEYNALIASFGWMGEGGSGFVIP